MTIDKEWGNHLTKIMLNRPNGNDFLESDRGMEIGKFCLAKERELFSWRRSDPDTFWIDVQLFTKYKLSNNEIAFIMERQPGIEEYKEHSKERRAYAEMMRGIKKLRHLEVEQ